MFGECGVSIIGILSNEQGRDLLKGPYGCMFLLLLRNALGGLLMLPPYLRILLVSVDMPKKAHPENKKIFKQLEDTQWSHFSQHSYSKLFAYFLLSCMSSIYITDTGS